MRLAGIMRAAFLFARALQGGERTRAGAFVFVERARHGQLAGLTAIVGVLVARRMRRLFRGRFGTLDRGNRGEPTRCGLHRTGIFGSSLRCSFAGLCDRCFDGNGRCLDRGLGHRRFGCGGGRFGRGGLNRCNFGNKIRIGSLALRFGTQAYFFGGALTLFLFATVCRFIGGNARLFGFAQQTGLQFLAGFARRSRCNRRRWRRSRACDRRSGGNRSDGRGNGCFGRSSFARTRHDFAPLHLDHHLVGAAVAEGLLDLACLDRGLQTQWPAAQCRLLVAIGHRTYSPFVSISSSATTASCDTTAANSPAGTQPVKCMRRPSSPVTRAAAAASVSAR